MGKCVISFTYLQTCPKSPSVPNINEGVHSPKLIRIGCWKKWGIYFLLCSNQCSSSSKHFPLRCVSQFWHAWNCTSLVCEVSLKYAYSILIPCLEIRNTQLIYGLGLPMCQILLTKGNHTYKHLNIWPSIMCICIDSGVWNSKFEFEKHDNFQHGTRNRIHLVETAKNMTF